MTYRMNLLLAGLLVLAGTVTGAAAQEAPVGASTPATIRDLCRMQPISGDAQAGAGKAVECAACHGAQGVAIAPNFPNLAGQSATCLYVQLKEFHDGERSDPVMGGQAAALSDADMRDLASYYAALAPKPAGPMSRRAARSCTCPAIRPRAFRPVRVATARMGSVRGRTPAARRSHRGRLIRACVVSPPCTWPRNWAISRASCAAAAAMPG